MAGVTALLSEMRTRLGGRTDLEARLPVFLNDGYYELLLSPRFSFFELDSLTTLTTVSGTRSYSLAAVTDLWFILDIRDTTNLRRIARSDVRVFDALNQPTASGQQPIKYARFGTSLEFDPTPGGAYVMNVRYRKRPPELTSGGSHLLGREWDEVLTVLGVVKGYEALEQPEKAAAQRQLLELLLSAREEPENLEDADAETTIGVMLEG